MRAVAWTDSSTRCWPATERASRRGVLRALAGLALGAWAGVRAAAQPLWHVWRRDEALLVQARVPLELPSALHEALLRGVALTFVWQAELRRPRWYWTDQVLLVARRTVRLTYQPLTQRWRLSVSDGAAVDEPGAALQRVLDTLQEALALVRSSQQWRIALPSALRGDERLELAFFLDTGRLPRPLQWLSGVEGVPPLAWRTALPLAAVPTVEPTQQAEEPA